MDANHGTGLESGIDFCEIRIDDDSDFTPVHVLTADTMTYETGLYWYKDFDAEVGSDGVTYYAMIRCQDMAGNLADFPAAAQTGCPGPPMNDDTPGTIGANVTSCGIMVDMTP